MEILQIDRQNESLTRKFSPPPCGQAFLPVHLASNTGGTWLTTFSIAKSRRQINNLSTGLSLLFFGRKIKVALVGIPALLGMSIFYWGRDAPVFEVELGRVGMPIAVFVHLPAGMNAFFPPFAGTPPRWRKFSFSSCKSIIRSSISAQTASGTSMCESANPLDA